MIYYTARINIHKNNITEKQEWKCSIEKSECKCSIEKSELKRVETNTVPNAMGFFHFSPEKMSSKEALNLLITEMTDQHENEIYRLKDSMNALFDLQRNIQLGEIK